MALLWAAMLALTLAVVQIGLLFYATQLALTAAEHGLRAGHAHGAEPLVDARSASEAFLAHTAGTMLQNTEVTATLDGDVLHVRVSGTAPAVLPGVTLRVTREASSGIERLAP